VQPKPRNKRAGTQGGTCIDLNEKGKESTLGFYSYKECNMIRTTLLSILIISFGVICNTINAQTPEWLWAKSAGGDSYENAYGIANDAYGNTIVIGDYSSSSLTFGSTTLTNTGGGNTFIVKYDVSGNVLWAKSIGGSAQCTGQSVTFDTHSNIIITGFFNGDSLAIDTNILTNSWPNKFEVFIVKYDSAGNVIWARSAGGKDADVGYSVTTDTHDNVYILGGFKSDYIYFDSVTIANTDYLTQDIFIAKYDKSGNLKWVKSAQGSTDDYCGDIEVDNKQNIIITGSFSSPSITFDTITLFKADINLYSGDLFVVKYDSLCNVHWAKRAGGANGDGSSDVVIDHNNNIIIVGSFRSDSISFGTFTLDNTGDSDFFVAKYGSKGIVQWAKKSISYADDAGIAVTLDDSDNLLITGFFSAPNITFGTITLSNTNYYYEIFIVKYNPAGDEIWGRSMGGAEREYVKGIVADNNNNAIIAGHYYSSDIVFDNTTITNVGNSDIYCAKLSPNPNSLDNSNYKIGLSVFPNPVFNNLTIALTNDIRKAEIEIFDIRGQLIMQHQAKNPVTKYNLSSFSSGVYIIKVKTDKGVAIKKIIK